jgi:hypothetical protein
VSGGVSWAGIALLGAYHGVNPAMGWLFAVARGLFERRHGAVLRSLLPIALGHEASLLLVVGLAGAIGLLVSPTTVRVVAAVGLLGFGVLKFAKPRSHPRWVGFRVSLAELALWSFLMATAHGAGLMLLPFLVGPSAQPTAQQAHVQRHGGAEAHELAHAGVGAGGSLLHDALALSLHTAAMLAVMAAVALVVYQRLGVAVLRRAWVNFEVVWAAVLVLTGLFTLFTA